MNTRRRRVITVTGAAFLSAVAGCSDQSDGGGGGYGPGDDEGGSTTESTTSTATPASKTPTETQSEAGMTTPTETRASMDPVGFVINNVGARAWEVAEDESGSVAPTNENNPTLSFEVGQRYAVENRGWSAHPFAIRDADDAPLLSQSADGRFEGDDAVNWTDNSETFAFTYTDDLATVADYYICTVHPGMRGSVETT